MDYIAIGYFILVYIKINYFILGKNKRRKFDQYYQRKGLVKGKFVRMSTSIKKGKLFKGIFANPESKEKQLLLQRAF